MFEASVISLLQDNTFDTDESLRYTCTESFLESDFRRQIEYLEAEIADLKNEISGLKQEKEQTTRFLEALAVLLVAKKALPAEDLKSAMENPSLFLANMKSPQKFVSTPRTVTTAVTSQRPLKRPADSPSTAPAKVLKVISLPSAPTPAPPSRDSLDRLANVIMQGKRQLDHLVKGFKLEQHPDLRFEVKYYQNQLANVHGGVSEALAVATACKHALTAEQLAGAFVALYNHLQRKKECEGELPAELRTRTEQIQAAKETKNPGQLVSFLSQPFAPTTFSLPPPPSSSPSIAPSPPSLLSSLPSPTPTPTPTFSPSFVPPALDSTLELPPEGEEEEVQDTGCVRPSTPEPVRPVPASLVQAVEQHHEEQRTQQQQASEVFDMAALQSAGR